MTIHMLRRKWLQGIRGTTRILHRGSWRLKTHLIMSRMRARVWAGISRWALLHLPTSLREVRAKTILIIQGTRATNPSTTTRCLNLYQNLSLCPDPSYLSFTKRSRQTSSNLTTQNKKRPSKNTTSLQVSRSLSITHHIITETSLPEHKGTSLISQ